MTMPPMLPPEADPMADPAFQGAVLEDEMARIMAGLSNNPMSPNEQMAPNPPEENGQPMAEREAALAKALYTPSYVLEVWRSLNPDQ